MLWNSLGRNSTIASRVSHAIWSISFAYLQTLLHNSAIAGLVVKSSVKIYYTQTDRGITDAYYSLRSVCRGVLEFGEALSRTSPPLQSFS